MFWRKILFLVAGYVAGNVVNTLYNSQKKRAIKFQKKEDMKLMIDSFVDTQKSFFSDMEKKYVPAEHKSSFEKKKKEFFKITKDLSKKGKELFQEVMDDERVQKTTKKVKSISKEWKLIARKMKDISKK